MQQAQPALLVRHLQRRYGAGPDAVAALRGVEFQVGKGEWVGLVGPSGCGKSTLLNLLGAIDRPDGGEIWVEGREVGGLDDRARTLLRRERMGFVFQFFHLLPTLTALENATLPLSLAGVAAAARQRAGEELLAELGLGERLGHYPHQLSGGQMQRVAIARAIIHSPALVLADEPTGNLDSATGEGILDLLGSLVSERGMTLIMATHAPEAAARCHRLLRMRDGQLEAP